MTAQGLPSLYSSSWVAGWRGDCHVVLLAEHHGRLLCAEAWLVARDGVWRWRVGELTLLGFDRWARSADPSATVGGAKEAARHCLETEANRRD